MNEKKANELLTLYLLGDLDNATQAEVQACLEQSESCRAEAREIEPTLDLLRAALAAPGCTPARLSAARKAKILECASSPKPGRLNAELQKSVVAARQPSILGWITVGWPGLARAAALLLACIVLVGLLIPATLSVRQAAREPESALRGLGTVDESGIAVNDESSSSRFRKRGGYAGRGYEGLSDAWHGSEASAPYETGRREANWAERAGEVKNHTRQSDDYELVDGDGDANGFGLSALTRDGKPTVPAAAGSGEQVEFESEAVVADSAVMRGIHVTRDNVSRDNREKYADPLAAPDKKRGSSEKRVTGETLVDGVRREITDVEGLPVRGRSDTYYSRPDNAVTRYTLETDTKSVNELPAGREPGKGEQSVTSKPQPPRTPQPMSPDRPSLPAIAPLDNKVVATPPTPPPAPRASDSSLRHRQEESTVSGGSAGFKAGTFYVPKEPAVAEKGMQAGAYVNAPIGSTVAGQELHNNTLTLEKLERVAGEGDFSQARIQRGDKGVKLRETANANAAFERFHYGASIGLDEGTIAASAKELVPLQVELPKPAFVGTPKKIKSDNLEPYPYAKREKNRPATVLEAQITDRLSRLSDGGDARQETLSGLEQTKTEAAAVAGPATERTSELEKRMPAKDAAPGLGDTPLLGKLFKTAEAEEAPADGQLWSSGIASRADATVDYDSFARKQDGRELGIDEHHKAQPEPETLGELPPPLDPTRFRAFGVNPFYTVKDQAFSTFSIDVDTASYTVARRYMSQGLLPPAEAVRTEEFVNFFDYGYKAPLHRTFRIYTDLAPSRFGRGLHLLKIGVKGRRLGREEQRQAVLTFLIDTSGSMDKPDRLGLVQQSLRLLLSTLNPEDRVAIIQYSSHARVIIEHTPVRDRKRILAAINDLQCGGSTNLEEGMRRAYQLAAAAFVAGGENRVLLLSDGVANLGTGDATDILSQIERYRKQGITCSVFGFGMGTYDDEMLETLANKGDGNYTFIDSVEQAQRVFVDDLSATLNTIASDVKIQVQFDPTHVKRYRQLGYENRQLAKQDFRNDAVDAGEVGSGQSVTALYELEFTGNASRLPVCVVRVRYRRVDTGTVEEIEQPVRPSDQVPEFARTSARFRLAAGVAEFAEILRASPHAAGSDYQDVATVLRPVALELDMDDRVQELLRLVHGAGSMSRGE